MKINKNTMTSIVMLRIHLEDDFIQKGIRTNAICVCVAIVIDQMIF